MTQASQLGHPVVVVLANYRQGAFGFLGGKEIHEDGATNLGLRDQRLALHWIAENVEAFGGDPDKVTIWGQSAGAVSVLYHTVINGGDHTYKGKPLFRGAIMNSGATQPAMPVDSDSAQHMYDYVVNKTRCAYSNTTLDCLRILPYDELAYAAQFVPSLVNLQGVAFSITPRPSPGDPFLNISAEEALMASPPRIAAVPIITGVQEDEGTFFAVGMQTPTPARPTASSTPWLTPTLTRRASTSALLSICTPAEPAAGSPYNTGTANEIYPGYKRNSAVPRRPHLQLHRRAYLAAVAARVPAWSFSASYRKSGVLGTFHGSDLLMLAEKWPAYPYYDIWQYYISFVYYLNPNQLSGMDKARSLLEWPRWENDSRKIVEFQQYGEAIAKDEARQAPYDYFRSVWSLFRI